VAAWSLALAFAASSSAFADVTTPVAGTAHAPAVAAAPLLLRREDARRLGAQQAPEVLHTKLLARAGSAARNDVAPLTYAPRVTLYAGPREFANGNAPGAELGAQVFQEFPTQNLVGARAGAASAESDRLHAEETRAEYDGAKIAEEAFDAALLSEAVFALRHRAEDDASSIVAQIQARVQRGVLSPEDGALAAAEGADARLNTLDAEGARTERLFALRRAVGLPPEAPLRLEGSIDVVPPMPHLKGISDAHPALALARAQTAREKSERTAIVAREVPAWGLGVTYMREGTGERTTLASVQLPIPIVDMARYPRAQADLRVLARESEARLLKDDLERQLAAALHECGHLREREELLNTAVLPKLREAVAVARTQVDRGVRDLPSFFVLRRRLLAAEEQLVAARASIRVADAHARHVAGETASEAHPQ